MTAFQQAGEVVKDFYYAPDNDVAGVFFPDELPLPDEENDVSPFTHEQLEMGKDLRTINDLIGNYTFPFPTPNEPFQRGSSRTRRFNTPTIGTVGVNLGNIGSRYMRDGYNENEVIDLITEMLSHEYGHSAIHDIPLSRDANENVATFIGRGV